MARPRAGARASRRVWSAASQHAHSALEAQHRRERCAVEQPRLGAAVRREHQRLEPRGARRVGRRERAATRPYAAVERELAEQRVRVQARVGELSARREDRARDREVEGGPCLRQVGRCEIRRDAAARELEARVADSGVHALARLAHGRVREADDREGRQAGSDVDLDRHTPRVKTVEREGVRARKQERSAAR